MSFREDDEVTDPRKETALRASMLVIGALMLTGVGLNAHLERHNASIAGAEQVGRLFDGVNQEMLVRQDLFEIAEFLTREQAQREVAILRLSEKVALSCAPTRDGDFVAEFHDIIGGKVSPWSWPSSTALPTAIDALCGMMLSTAQAAQNG